MEHKIKAAAKQALNEGDDALSDDEILAELENDPELEHLREARLNQLKREIGNMRDLRARGHGEYSSIQKEETMVQLLASAERGVVHFAHPQFARCKVLDKHLDLLGRYHFETRFATISVESCPFLVAKFQIRMLPCVLMVVNGSVVDRLVGFEELGNDDGFSTETLERRLARSGAIQMPLGEMARVPVRERPLEFRAGTSKDGHASSPEDGADW
ncbi:hypothetical protein GGF46_002360 [Coemansia sp. RSA 552]|nr:hypothetical protein GGF46_002360 [Coemansia sp. RSA 552]